MLDIELIKKTQPFVPIFFGMLGFRTVILMIIYLIHFSTNWGFLITKIISLTKCFAVVLITCALTPHTLKFYFWICALEEIQAEIASLWATWIYRRQSFNICISQSPKVYFKNAFFLGWMQVSIHFSYFYSNFHWFCI